MFSRQPQVAAPVFDCFIFRRLGLPSLLKVVPTAENSLEGNKDKCAQVLLAEGGVNYTTPFEFLM
jgi:hypothetical protein